MSRAVPVATDVRAAGAFRGPQAAGGPKQAAGLISSWGGLPLNRGGAAIAWDMWVASAIAIVEFLVALLYDLSPRVAFVLTFALSACIALQTRLDGRSS